MALWAVLVLMFFFFWQFFQNGHPQTKDVSYSEFLTYVEQGQVQDLSIKGQTYTFHLKTSGKPELRVTGTTPSDALLDRLHNHQVDFKIEKEDQNGIWLSIRCKVCLSPSSSCCSSSSCASCKDPAARP